MTVCLLNFGPPAYLPSCSHPFDKSRALASDKGSLLVAVMYDSKLYKSPVSSGQLIRQKVKHTTNFKNDILISGFNALNQKWNQPCLFMMVVCFPSLKLDILQHNILYDMSNPFVRCLLTSPSICSIAGDLILAVYSCSKCTMIRQFFLSSVWKLIIRQNDRSHYNMPKQY